MDTTGSTKIPVQFRQAGNSYFRICLRQNSLDHEKSFGLKIFWFANKGLIVLKRENFYLFVNVLQYLKLNYAVRLF